LVTVKSRSGALSDCLVCQVGLGLGWGKDGAGAPRKTVELFSAFPQSRLLLDLFKQSRAGQSRVIRLRWDLMRW
jgi:hypothetical protein